MRKRIINMVAAALVAVIWITVLSGCAASSKPVTGDAQKVVLAYTEPITDNVLTGLNANDYTIFSRDFNDKMQKGLTEDVFNQTYQMINGKIGKYVSRSVVSVSEADNLITVIYSGKFEKEDGVTIRVIVQKNSEHPLAGLWMDSPALRK